VRLLCPNPNRAQTLPAGIISTDALAAAWMAKHFGMRFTARWLGPRPQREYECMFDDWHFEVHENNTGHYYIHPDSLNLLEPRAGDIARVRSIPGEPESEPAAFRIHIDNTKHDVIRIIQRNGKPFFWPEQERA
jgi:hypothetical protein